MGLWQKILNWLKGMFWAKELEISVVGIQNAGKTTFVNLLSTSQYDEDTIPTIGFNYKTVKKGKTELKIWDLGGQPRFRESWEKYCRKVDCIVFICDSADYGNLDLGKQQLHSLMSYPSLSGIPLLVLGNKNDLEGALTEEELIQALSLDKIYGRQIACYSVSCKSQNNIDTTLKWLSSVEKRK